MNGWDGWDAYGAEHASFLFCAFFFFAFLLSRYVTVMRPRPERALNSEFFGRHGQLWEVNIASGDEWMDGWMECGDAYQQEGILLVISLAFQLLGDMSVSTGLPCQHCAPMIPLGTRENKKVHLLSKPSIGMHCVICRAVTTSLLCGTI